MLLPPLEPISTSIFRILVRHSLPPFLGFFPLDPRLKSETPVQVRQQKPPEDRVRQEKPAEDGSDAPLILPLENDKSRQNAEFEATERNR